MTTSQERHEDCKLIGFGRLVAAETLSHSLEVQPFSAAALAEAEKENQPVALLFHAAWCPPFRAQDEVVQTLKTENLLCPTILKFNYDTENDLKRRFKVDSQSPLIAVCGQKGYAPFKRAFY